MMKRMHVAAAICLAILGVAPARAQFGLYGSPEVLRLPDVRQTSGANTYYAGNSYATTPASPLLGQEMIEPVPDYLSTGEPSLEPDAYPIDNGDYSMADACGMGVACGGCDKPTCCPWYGSAALLTMGRDLGDKVWLSYEDGNNSNQMTHSRRGLRWKLGGEVRVGRRFCYCGVPYALEVGYWTTQAFSSYTVTSHPSGVSTPLIVGDIEFNGVTATNWFDGAAEHRFRRYNEFHNVDVNVLCGGLVAARRQPWAVDWLAGFRYFRFEENWSFGSVRGGFVFGQDPAQEAYLDDSVTNSLLALHFGLRADRTLWGRWQFFVSPQVGLGNNHIEHYFHAHLGDGTPATTGASGVVGTYPVRSSTDVLSFLGQLDVGLKWQFSQRWSAMLGYRVMVLTDMALSDDQIPQYIVDIPEIADIEHNATLLLHGAFLGVTFNY